MQVQVKSNDGKRVVLTQSYFAKIALYFSKDFCLVNAVNLASLAVLSYTDFEALENRLLKNSFKVRSNFNPEPVPSIKPFLLPYNGKKDYSTQVITEIKATSFSPNIIDTQAFHFNDDEYNVFAFRGTKELKDFATDGFAPKIFFLAGDVHQGFYENFKAIKDQIITILSKPENKKCKTIISGHSLGGALATLTAAYISTNYMADPCGQVMLYTYGSPRVGTVPWVNAFENKFIHFRHRRVHDPITMLPPHHSSMKMPSLPVMIATGVVGGVALIVGEAIFNSGEAEDAFIHHGQGILLREGNNGYTVTKTELKKEFVVQDGSYWNSKEALLAREFVKNVTSFDSGMTPHSKGGYFANLFHLLKEAIRAWDHDPNIWLDINKAISKQEAEFIEVWKKERERDAFAVKTQPAVQGTTSTPESRQPITQEQKTTFYNEIIETGMMLKTMADNEVKIWSQPGAKDKLLQLILPEPLSPDIEKELRYQLTVLDGATPRILD